MAADDIAAKTKDAASNAADAARGDFSDLFGAINVVVKAVRGAINFGSYISGDPTDLDPGAIVNQVTKSANQIRENMDQVFEATKKAGEEIKSLKASDIADSAKHALGSLQADIEGDAKEALDSISNVMLTTQASAKLPSMGDVVGIMDSCNSGLAFGYQPVDSAIKMVKNLVGPDSDFAHLLSGLDDAFEAVGEAIPFIGMAIQLVSFGIDTVEQNNQQLIQDTNLFMQRMNQERAERRSRKPPLRAGSLIRIDGTLYSSSVDARVRDDVLNGAMWKFKPGNQPELKLELYEGVVHDVFVQSADTIRKQMSQDKWELRAKIARATRDLTVRHQAVLDGRGRLFSVVDGERAFEHAKDLMLMQLIRAGAVSVKEVQIVGPDPLSDMDSSSMKGTNYKMTGGSAIMYAHTAPGSAIWNYWNDLARKQPLLYSSRVAKAAGKIRAVSPLRLSAKIDARSSMDVGKIIKNHPVATAGAAGAILGGLYSLLKK